MTLRSRILLYLAALHLALAAAAWVLLGNHRPWLLGVELTLVGSAWLGTRLVRDLLVPRELARTGAELIAEGDLASRFRPVGRPDIDALISVYNRMIARLREERLELEERDLFLGKVLELVPMGLVRLDHDGRIEGIDAAAADLLGLDPETLPGRSPEALAPPLAAVPRDGSAVLTTSDGRRLKVHRLELTRRGFPRQVLLVEEVTEELRRSERTTYERMIRLLSHEINNSVGAVGSLLASLRELPDPLDGADRRDLDHALAVSASRLDHLAGFVEGFAAVVRLPPPDPRPTDLGDLVEGILRLLAPQLEARRIEWAWVEREALPPVAVDRTQMEQVLVNVLTNAMEAIGEAGTIRLALGREQGHLRLLVTDSGRGLPEGTRGELFAPLFTTKRQGRGLGLTLVAEVLRRHGCRFALDDAPEGGAVFSIRFPGGGERAPAAATGGAANQSP